MYKVVVEASFSFNLITVDDDFNFRDFVVVTVVDLSSSSSTTVLRSPRSPADSGVYIAHLVGWTRGKNGSEWVTERADVVRVEGRRRPRLRWQDCLKRDLEGEGGENEREGCRRVEREGRMREWRMRGRDGGVENEREGWESGE